MKIAEKPKAYSGIAVAILAASLVPYYAATTPHDAAKSAILTAKKILREEGVI